MKKLLCGLMALACATLLTAPCAAQIAGSLPSCASHDPKGNCLTGIVDPTATPGTHAGPVVTSDTTDQWTSPNVPRAIYVGAAGDIVMIGVDAPASAVGVTWKAVPVGTIIPFRPRRILTTGTSAANLVAIF